VFRDYFASVLLQLGFKQGVHEPCAFYHEAWQCRVMHHTDDGLIVGPPMQVGWTLAGMAEHLLLKVCGSIDIGCCFEQLGRLRVRVDANTWWTIPDRRHAESVIADVLGNRGSKSVSTPGVKKCTRVDSEELLLGESDTLRYRSAVGSLIFLAGDREDLQFCVKQLAKRLHSPGRCDWEALCRVAKYLRRAGSWIVEQNWTPNRWQTSSRSTSTPIGRVIPTTRGVLRASGRRGEA